MSASCWPQIAALQGRTLQTVARRKAFTVTQVTHAHVELTVQDGGRTRILYRKDLEPFYERLVRQGVLTIAEIKTVYKFNSSLAAGLLAALPGVTATPQPITLRYRR
jgi:hypothetical protein